MRKHLYRAFVNRFGAHQWHWLYHPTAMVLEGLFGRATFNYGGIKLKAGPVAFLDRFIIRGENINPLVTSAIKTNLTENSVFLDIGANHGVFSLLAAKNPNTCVFAFEPASRELQRLWKNLSLNPSNNISVLAFGISDAEKTETLSIAHSKNPGMNSLPSIYSSRKTEKCHFSTLIHLLSPDVLKRTRVIKIDIEGQEMTLLNSLQSHMQLLKQSVFIVEISPLFLSKVGFKAEDIYHFFNTHGFKAQFGMRENHYQWDDIFYHPDFSNAIPISESLQA